MAPSLRQAFRGLARTPVFTATSILSLGIGIGLATSVFAVVHSLFLAPLPYAAPDRLVELWQTEVPGSDRPVDYLQPERMLGWVGDELRSIRGVAGRGLGAPMVLELVDGAERVDVERVVGDWFGTLGVPAERGRLLTLADQRPGAEPAAVVSHAFWRDRLGGDPDVLGRVLRLSGTAFTVVGVMPSAFPSNAPVWVPVASVPAEARPVAYAGVARLAEGATPSEAAREIERLSAAQVAADSGRWGGRAATATSMGAMARSGDKPMLWILAGVVGAVLLIGLSNLTALFLVRAQERSASLAVRASLGASTWQLGRGLAAEALLLGLASSALGLLLAGWGKDVGASLLGAGGAATGEPVIGLPAAGVALGLGALVPSLIGLEPLRRLRSLDARVLLQGRSAGTSGTRGERRTRNVLVGAQVALCVILVAFVGVLRSAHASFAAIDVGYDARRLVQAIPDYGLTGLDGAAQWELARQVAERVRRRAGVEGVALWRSVMQGFPPRPEFDAAMSGPPRDLTPFQRLGRYYEVAPGFFGALGLELLRGRAFAEADGPGAPLVAVVTHSGAEAWWPGQDPLGRQIRLGRDGVWMTVIGVVEDTGIPGPLGRGFLINGRPLPALFRPALQATSIPEGWRAHNCAACDGVVIAVRAAGETSRAAAILRSAMVTLAPGLPLRAMGPVFEQQMGSYYGRRLSLTGNLLAAGSAAGLLLAVIGIVGLVSESLARRTREIGLRMALGARARQVTTSVARESAGAVLAGSAVGIAALVASRDLVAGTFYSWEVRRLAHGLLEPGILAPATVGVLAVSLVAAWLTARRTVRVDPAVVLRGE